MAKTAWGPGAWALETERAEAEKKEASLNVQNLGGEGDGSFPSLGEATAKTGKQKKKKGQTLSFSEFAAGVYVGPGGRSRQTGEFRSGLTTDERMMLPTRPRERSAADETEGYGAGKLGGGFRHYGGSREEGLPNRNSAGGFEQWGPNRRPFDENNAYRKQTVRNEEVDFPSRADEADNWAVSKKLNPSVPSRSDYEASDNWGASKKPFNPPSRQIYAATRADEVDNWGAGKKSVEPIYSASRSQDPVVGKGFESLRSEAKPKANPFGSARPREEVLAEKGQDWRKLDAEFESRSNASRPTSSQSSRPDSSHSSRPESPMISLQSVASPSSRRPKVNPFGDAKPREMLLEMRGVDYRKIDVELEHKAVHRPETQEEQKLKEEINALKELAEETASSESKMNNLNLDESTSKETLPDLQEKISFKEKQLEMLTRDLDDKVRYGKKSGGSRPGSAAGQLFEHIERLEKKDGDSRPGSAASGGPFEHVPRFWKKGGHRRHASEAGGPFEYLTPGSQSGQFNGSWKKGGHSRPGSFAGDSFEFLDRPGSQSGQFDGLWKKGGHSRSGSVAGDPSEYLERPGSQSGQFDGSKNDPFEFSRPRRGDDRVDVWTRPNEERRGMLVNREMSFPDKKSSKSRERW